MVICYNRLNEASIIMNEETSSRWYTVHKFSSINYCNVEEDSSEGSMGEEFLIECDMEKSTSMLEHDILCTVEESTLS